MDFFEAVERRRSIRRFTDEPVPQEVIRKALEAALLAPNSSNVQTWDFYWVRDAAKKERLVKICLDQSAARTAQELVVITADPKRWKRSNEPLIRFVEEIQAPKAVQDYYRKLVPIMYRWGIFDSLGAVKKVAFEAVGLVRPIMRGPATKRDLQEVAIKSAALAAENFVLALEAQGFQSCMMEGFDERRARRLLGLGRSARVVMVVGVGKAAERGTWGPRFRIPSEQVLHEV
jgi:nitroreductase